MLTMPTAARRCLGMAASGLVLTAFAVNAQIRNPWWGTASSAGQAAMITSTAAVFSCVVLVLAGSWLAWRLPTNHTGWWVAGSGFLLAGWILGTYTVQPASPWFSAVLPPMYKAALVVAVLRWPTGRLHPRWAKALGWAVAAYVGIGVTAQFIGYMPPVWFQHVWTLPAAGDLVTGLLVDGATRVLLSAIAPAVFLAALYRLRAGMPAGARSTATPAFVAAAVLGLTELLTFTADANVLNPTSLARQRLTGADQAAMWAVDFGRYGVVGLLLVWSESMRRRRRAGSSTATTAVELGPLEMSADTSDEVARILGDSSARLVVVVPDEWASSAPGDDEATRVGAGRGLIEIADRSGSTVAIIDHDPAVIVGSATLDALMASVGLAVIHSARQRDAELRTADVRQVQRRVLDAQDRARRRLERDLHDGVQQRLVALALDASLLARRETTRGVSDEDRLLLQTSIDDAAVFSHLVIREGPPGVLDPGLAAGLVALDASIPLGTHLDLSGDVLAAHPAATALWFVASEAVANCLKHADASEIIIRLLVEDGVAQLTIADDGRGGGLAVPAAIVRRLAGSESSIEHSSPPGRGTSISVRVPLATTAVPA